MMTPKFRAFNELLGEFVRVDKNVIFDQSGELSAPPHIKLLQSTGLKDKNGKEAFNGDIINDGGSVGVIVTEVGKAPEVKLHHKNGLFSNELLRFLQDFEIIGNIHQHPEFLESK